MIERFGHDAATRLRAEFDHGFTLPHKSAAPADLDLLLIGVDGHRYALLLSQLLALHADRKLTEAPSPHPALLGLAGLRGAVTPVYDLSRLLGYAAAPSPRWLVQVDAPAPFAVAFERFDAHLRLSRASFARQSGDAKSAPAHVSGSVTTAEGPVTTLDLLTLFESSIRVPSSSRTNEPGEERT